MTEETLTLPAELSPAEARARFRDGLVAPTAGWSRGWAQANLLTVPLELAYDFLLFAQRNPKPCPVLDVLDAGAVSGPLLDGDIRTDVPAYRVYVDGELVEETTDVRGFWRDDLVSFLVGCASPSRRRCSRRVSRCGTWRSRARRWPSRTRRGTWCSPTPGTAPTWSERAPRAARPARRARPRRPWGGRS